MPPLRPTRAQPPRYFTPQSFRFLAALAKHNDRSWFLAHKQAYIDTLREPMSRLIADLAPRLTHISSHFMADPRPQGGSMFRIYRDVRFRRDKRPYKEWVSFKLMQERAREMDGDVPGFYLHVQPGQCFAGAGVWRPNHEHLLRIRNYLLDNPASWKAATRTLPFRRRFEMGGESLKRPPHGFDPMHELIDDLKRKDFVAHCALADDALLRSDLPTLLMRNYRALAPMNDWLCGALDLDF
ncbi:MAG TPA: TIGR02453 family protein [Nevskiaceae bacterium]|nr:TIGR02453 family protein [Nevskiaceae bacterium]